jgi:hypothetical protein
VNLPPVLTNPRAWSWRPITTTAERYCPTHWVGRHRQSGEVAYWSQPCNLWGCEPCANRRAATQIAALDDTIRDLRLRRVWCCTIDDTIDAKLLERLRQRHNRTRRRGYLVVQRVDTGHALAGDDLGGRKPPVAGTRLPPRKALDALAFALRLPDVVKVVGPWRVSGGGSGMWETLKHGDRFVAKAYRRTEAELGPDLRPIPDATILARLEAHYADVVREHAEEVARAREAERARIAGR